ncbi:alpha/beta fold hydrolase [Candidatus Phyllobacterium onerii]|uniref:alpha/beta fold hydrolase n=1 Tax=Candidatus Phyllobacterium onerii TaxID=3020828 RepID=UPI00232DE33D|nr:alpha/beta hydrolase [Phyllobacterium sp. IY22]
MHDSHPAPLMDGYHSIDIDGMEQRFFVAGSRDGPVCVAHSGGPGIAWEYLRMLALEERLRMVYIEPVGTGQSGRFESHPYGYDVDTYARFLYGLVEYLNLQKVYLLGHSHGGFVAQNFTVAHPEKLAGLILYDTAPAAGTELFAEATRNLESFRQRNKDRPETASIMRAWYSLGGIAGDASFRSTLYNLFPAYFADYWKREEEFRALRNAVTGSYVGSAKRFDNTDGLALITVPTLILVGVHDFICGPRWAYELRDGIRGSQLVKFAESGHFAHLEETQRFAHVLGEFCGAQRAA